MLPTFPIVFFAVVLVCLSPEVASQQCRSGVTDEVKQSVREQLRQYQSGGNNRTFPTVAVNCGQVQTETILITPRYAQEHATVTGSYTTFETRFIYIGTGGQAADTRLQVPIVPAGRFSTNASVTVKITAALDGSMLNQRSVDRDVRIGITDGRVMNDYEIVDINNYPNWPPCYALSASGLRKTLSSGPVPDQFTFLFKPAERFGACFTAQNGGYVNVDTFNSQLDLSLGISLRLHMHEANEDIRYYYLLVEITQ